MAREGTRLRLRRMSRKPGGWKKEPARHALASKGVKTRRLKYPYIVGHPERQPDHIEREMADILKIEHELGNWEDGDPKYGTIFRDLHTGEKLKFIRVERHPKTNEVVNIIFESADGEERADRDYSEVYPAED